MKNSKFFIFLPILFLGLGCKTTDALLDSATASLKSLKPGNDIHTLAAKGNNEGIKALLAEKGNEIINSRNEIGNTPLMMAAFKGRSDTIETLLEHGADVTLKNKDGETAFHAAAQGAQPETFRYLQIGHASLANKADYNAITPYMRAAYSGINATFFADTPDNVFFAKDADGSDLLSWAVGGNNISVVRYYAERAGENLNMDKLRLAHLENFDNPNSQPSLRVLAEVYCSFALKNTNFKPASSDGLKFGRYCGYDFEQLKEQRNG